MAKNNRYEYSDDGYWDDMDKYRDKYFSSYYSRLHDYIDRLEMSVEQQFADIEHKLDNSYKKLANFDNWHYDVSDSDRRWFKMSYSKLPRGELMVPVQQSLEARWLEEEHFFEKEYDDEINPLDDWALRHRLGWAAFNGTAYGSAGILSGSMILGSGLAGMILGGGAAAVGAGYGLYETRKNKADEASESMQYIDEPEQLRDSQIDQIERVTHGVGWAGSNIWHRRDIYTAQELDEALLYVGGETSASKTDTLLDWLDQRSASRSRRNIEDGVYSDAGDIPEALVKFIAVYKHQGLGDVKDSFDLSPYQSVPLYLQALIRMKERQAFMNEFAVEFDVLEDIVAHEHELNEELDDVKGDIKNIGSSAYYEMRMEEIQSRQNELEKAIILQDIKMASLAYAFDQSAKELSDYTPADTEMFETSQLEQWQRGIDEISTMDTAGMSEQMADLVIQSLNECIATEPTGRYGSAVCEVANYLRQVSGHVKNNESSTEALRRIRSILTT